MSDGALKDRLEVLEEVLGINRSMASRLREAFGLAPLQAQTLGMLLAREHVPRRSLYDALYAAANKWPDDKVLDGHICWLRRHLRSHGVVIRTHWGEGWSIAPADKARIRAMLEGRHEAGHRIEAVAS